MGGDGAKHSEYDVSKHLAVMRSTVAAAGCVHILRQDTGMHHALKGASAQELHASKRSSPVLQL